MRVLCLHPSQSSALHFSQSFSKLEERLWSKHGIELVFVDAPLLDVHIGNAVGEEGGGITALQEARDGDKVSRRWFVEESTAKRALPPSTPSSSSDESKCNNNDNEPTIQYSGLDASLLHLSQIWSRGGANISNNLGECFPFQGVLGIGQGASVAGLLPLLNYGSVLTGGDDSDDDEEEESSGKEGGPTMFQGLQFVVLIDGQDILSHRNNGNESNDGNEIDGDCYVGPDGVHSLHVIAKKTNETAHDNDDDDSNKQQQSSSEQLAKKYGPNAKLTYYKPSSPSNKDTSDTPTPALSNIIGKFLVSQKNTLHSSPQKRQILSLQNQLSTVEQLATLAISNEIQKNPPKALMAVIGPAAMMNGGDCGCDGVNDENDAGNGSIDEIPTNNGNGKKKATRVDARTVVTHQEQNNGSSNKYQSRVGGGKENNNEVPAVMVDKAVGAWHGARRRGFGEEGGGAPCPMEFLLKQEERQS